MGSIRAELDLPPAAPVDLNYTADMSSKMNVPHHITLGESQRIIPTDPAGHFERLMAVPERIILGGNQQNFTTRGSEKSRDDVLFDHKLPQNVDQTVMLETPPRSLTLDQVPFPTCGENKSGASTLRDAVQLNPNPPPSSTLPNALFSTTDEVRLLKRHITRLSAKVAQLEQENELRKQRDTILFYLVALYIGAKTFFWFRRA